MKDLQEMSKLLFPGYFTNADCRGTYRHPLHRDDELYSASSAHQQVEMLARRTAEKGATMTTKKKKGSPHVRSSVAIPSTSSARANSSSSGVSQKSKRNDSSDVSSSNRMTVSPNENIQQSNQMEEEPTTITMQRKRALPTATDAVIMEVAAKSNQQPLQKASKFKSPRL